MADYYNSQQLAQMLGIAEANIADLQTKGLLQPTVKDGRSFFSSRQAHCLRAAVRWARRDKIDLQEALARVEERWLAHTTAPKD
jgi:DNA-binding transcriptional MerR regulator